MLIRPVSNQMPSINWNYGSYVQNTSAKKKWDNDFYKFFSLHSETSSLKARILFSFIFLLSLCDSFNWIWHLRESELVFRDWTTNRTTDFTLIGDLDLRYINFILLMKLRKINSISTKSVQLKQSKYRLFLSIWINCNCVLVKWTLYTHRNQNILYSFGIWITYGMHRH